MMDATTSTLLFGAIAGLWTAAATRRQRRRIPLSAAGPESWAKWNRVIQGGTKDLILILDFDRTITSFWWRRPTAAAPGERGQSCHGVVESTQTPELKAKAEALNAYFYPIETSASLTREEKIPYMRAWYASINSLLVEAKLTRASLVDSVRRAHTRLRDGIDRVFAFAAAHDVPLIVFSAGISDVLEEVIRQRYGALHAKYHIVSNRMCWSDDADVDKVMAEAAAAAAELDATPSPVSPRMRRQSVAAASVASGSEGASPVPTGIRTPTEPHLVAFREPLIHMYNKAAAHHVEGTSWFHELVGRKHAVLLGDGLGDVTMADGLPVQEVLRVGFLNDHIPALKKDYMAAFDIVLEDDAPADLVVDLLHEVHRNESDQM